MGNLQLKFRVFDKKNQKIYPTEYEIIKEIHFGMHGEVDGVVIAEFLPDESWAFKKLENVELLQYTGIKDKNGKEIYEGDVVKAIDENDEIYGIGAVEFCCGCWYVGRSIDEPLWDLKRDYLIEVIGNIFENLELLEQR